MSHWMSRVARQAQFDGAESLEFASDASIRDVWVQTSDICSVPPSAVASAVAGAFALEVADFDTAAPTAVKLLPESVVKKYGVYPLRDEDRALLVATSDPADTDAEQEISFASGRTARFVIASPDRIQQAIDGAYEPDAAASSMLSQISERFREAEVSVELEMEGEASSERVEEAETSAGPIVKLANIVLHEAIARGASDIHIQPMAGQGVVRFRTDGVLHTGMQFPLPVMTRVVSRIKIMAKLDITDRLRPQDGRAKIVVDGIKYDLRVSTVPVRNAEKAVIRVLDTQGAGTLAETGIEEAELGRIRKALVHRDGIVIVTGPTGSGKTTTMYGALQEIATDDINIMTVEDPVEYELAQLTQIQVEHKQGMTFASALRAILRQDPDVIFVGEIRDEETAEIAAQASLTGHLVLATLHTNDAVGAIRRFVDLGLDTGTIAETLRGVLAQRLIRKICEACAEPVTEMNEDEAALAARYGHTPPVRAVGCEACFGSGYSGRLPLTEFMVPTPHFVAQMLAEASSIDLKKQAVADGMRTLLDSALARVDHGLTTLQEVERVVGLEEGGEAESKPTAPEVPARAADTPASQNVTSAGSRGALTEPIVGPSRMAAVDGSEIMIGRAATPLEPVVPGSEPAPAAQPAAATAAPVGGGSESGGYAPAPGYAPAVGGTAAAVETADRTSAAPTGVASPEAGDDVPHILLVDDDGTTRKIARTMIEKHLGFRVSESPDGGDALLRLARGETFSLMVLDLDMPTLGGREVLRSVRQSIATAGLPVVVLTGTPDEEAEIELMEMGADDYLRKPIVPARLQTRIKAALRRAQG